MKKIFSILILLFFMLSIISLASAHIMKDNIINKKISPSNSVLNENGMNSYFAGNRINKEKSYNYNMWNYNSNTRRLSVNYWNMNIINKEMYGNSKKLYNGGFSWF